MTHIGMFRTGFGTADKYLFSQDEMNRIKRFLCDYRKYVDSNYAGHIHRNWHAVVWTGLLTTLYHVRITDEIWYDTQWPEGNDQESTVRWVQVNTDGAKISYRQHVNWTKVNRVVRNLRRRIYRATTQGDLKKVRSLQKLMLRNRANVLQSIRRVTQQNKGKRTPGVDRQFVLTDHARGRLAEVLLRYQPWRAKPVPHLVRTAA